MPALPMTLWLELTINAESGGVYTAVGDGGRSRGPYQIQQKIWEFYGGKKPWIMWAHDPRESRRVCKLVLRACAAKCKKEGKDINFKNVRYYYTHGGF